MPTEITEIKIGYIGGGSRNWARNVMTDLALCQHLTGEIALYDIDYAAAEENVTHGTRSLRIPTPRQRSESTPIAALPRH